MRNPLKQSIDFDTSCCAIGNAWKSRAVAGPAPSSFSGRAVAEIATVLQPTDLAEKF
jgi:hypothetical protein